MNQCGNERNYKEHHNSDIINENTYLNLKRTEIEPSPSLINREFRVILHQHNTKHGQGETERESHRTNRNPVPVPRQALPNKNLDHESH